MKFNNVITIILLFLCHYSVCNEKCAIEKKFFRFYKVRSCYRSNLPMVSRRNFNTVQECIKFANERNGLAFNFRPQSAKNLSDANYWIPSCQIMGCPETDTNTLVFDPEFDYYSAFGNFNATKNATCIKNIGLFTIIEKKLNYISAINFCQNLNGDLADILSETRTNSLAQSLKSLKNWYKAAYVGLDDIDIENRFQNPYEELLDCSTFRAWAAGHPRPHRTKDDCVILDSDKTWRVINCNIKMPFICEFNSMPPEEILDYTLKDCSNISTKKGKRKCLEENQWFELLNTSSRIDQCALFNNID